MGRMALFLSGAAVGLLVVSVFAGPFSTLLGSLVDAHRAPPVSSMDPLPAYVRSQVVYANFTSTIKHGSIRWTELWFQREGAGYALYAPPWNPKGHWVGSPGNDANDHDDDDDDDDGPSHVSGTIPFDTFLTGGEGAYDFYTIAVAKKHLREDVPDGPKASTFVDGTAPELSVSRPAANAWTATADLEWSSADDASGVDSVAITLDDAPVGTLHPPSGRLALANLAPGGHTVEVGASDRAGNVRSVVVPFSYDPNAPAVQFSSPAPGSYLGARAVSLSWTAADTASGIDHFSLIVDSRPAETLAASDRSRVLDAVPEGTHVVALTAVDAAGNSASAALSFTVDVTPPNVAIVAPLEGAFVAGRSLAVLWSADDALSGVAKYALSLDFGAPVDVRRAGAYTFASVGEGLHAVSVTAIDRAGNEARAIVRSVLDATPPAIVVLSPVLGSTLTGSVRASWRAVDLVSGIARLDLALDGGSPLDGTGITEYTFSSPSIGPHALTITGLDRAGNEAQAVVAFSVVPAPATPAGVPSIEIWAIIAIMGIAGFTFWAVRQRSKGSRSR